MCVCVCGAVSLEFHPPFSLKSHKERIEGIPKLKRKKIVTPVARDLWHYPVWLNRPRAIKVWKRKEEETSSQIGNKKPKRLLTRNANRSIFGFTSYRFLLVSFVLFFFLFFFSNLIWRTRSFFMNNETLLNQMNWSKLTWSHDESQQGQDGN